MSLLNFKALKWVRAVVFESLSWHICFFDQCTFKKPMLASVPQSGTANLNFWGWAHGAILGLTSTGSRSLVGRILKVTDDSLLFHAFAYHYSSVSSHSVNSDMTGHSHSFHAMKLIHCSASQRDVLSDKMVL